MKKLREFCIFFLNTIFFPLQFGRKRWVKTSPILFSFLSIFTQTKQQKFTFFFLSFPFTIFHPKTSPILFSFLSLFTQTEQQKFTFFFLSFPFTIFHPKTSPILFSFLSLFTQAKQQKFTFFSLFSFHHFPILSPLHSKQKEIEGEEHNIEGE